MVHTRMKDLVLLPDGRQARLEDLADNGHVEFVMVERNGRRAPFAVLKGSDAGWRVSRTAFKSRTGQKVRIGDA